MSAPLIVYGGAFDPPHIGHVMSVAWARAVLSHRIAIVPSYDHPFGKKSAPFNERMAMCRCAFGHISGVYVSGEQADIKSGFMADLLQHFDECRLGPLAILIGSDNWDLRHKWHQWEKVCKLADVHVIGRDGNSMMVNVPSVSSTSIRKALLEGSEMVDGVTLSKVVPSDVLGYIRRSPKLREWYGVKE